MRWRAALAGLVALAAWPVAAQPGDDGAAEIALWKSVIERNEPSDYWGYLLMFPNGRFAALARLRAGQAAPQAPGPGPATGPGPGPGPDAARVLLRPMKRQVRLVEGVVLDTEASALSRGSNHRLIVMPQEAPDAVTDTDQFVLDSTAIGTGRLHLTIPGGPAGEDEVRLYYIAPYASAFSVAARTPVTVQPGYPGAVLARDLVREALRLGPVRFEAAHKGRAMLVQGGFLQVLPSSEWNTAWFGGVPISTVQMKVLVVSIGLPGGAPDEHGSKDEVVCALVATPALLDRFATMEVGTTVVFRGVPFTWSSAGWRDPVPLQDCSLQDAG